MFKFSRRVLAMVAAALIVLVAIISLVLSSRDRNTGVDLESGKYYDKNSGETVSDPEGKGPDTYGAQTGQPIYLGLDVFFDAGLTDTQITRLKYAFNTYSSQNKKNIKEVSIHSESLSYGARPTRTEPFNLSFLVTFDRKDTVKGRMEYKGLDDIHLFLYDQKTNTLIFDSGVLDTRTKT